MLAFDYISGFVSSALEPRTQLALRYSMLQPLLSSDRPGYIYALELAGTCCGKDFQVVCAECFRLDASKPDLIRIKVGRSVDVHSRLSQHRNRCPSSKPRLLGYFPSAAPPLRAAGVPFCDRLERLVHIELAELSAKSYPPARSATNQPCVDCQCTAQLPVSI